MASRIRELVISRRNTIPTGGISPNRPLEITAPNCTERMPTRTSHTGEKRGVDTRFTRGDGWRRGPCRASVSPRHSMADRQTDDGKDGDEKRPVHEPELGFSLRVERLGSAPERAAHQDKPRIGATTKV